MQTRLEDFTVNSRFDVGEVYQCVKRWGTAVLPGWLDGRRLAGLRGEFEEVLSAGDDEAYYKIGYPAGRAASINRGKLPEGRHPFIQEVFQDPKMAAMAHRYVGSPCLLNYELYVTHEYNGSGIVAPTHFDKLWTLKFMIYLEDVNPGDCPFGVIPGSADVARRRFRKIFEKHRLKMLEVSSDAYHQMGNDQVPGEMGPVVDIVAPAGTLIVFDTDTFHRAGSLEPGRQRKVMRGHSGPSEVYKKVPKHGRQWWRGEKAFGRLGSFIEKLRAG
jgi:hypothetical protein